MKSPSSSSSSSSEYSELTVAEFAKQLAESVKQIYGLKVVEKDGKKQEESAKRKGKLQREAERQLISFFNIPEITAQIFPRSEIQTMTSNVPNKFVNFFGLQIHVGPDIFGSSVADCKIKGIIASERAEEGEEESKKEAVISLSLRSDSFIPKSIEEDFHHFLTSAGMLVPLSREKYPAFFALLNEIADTAKRAASARESVLSREENKQRLEEAEKLEGDREVERAQIFRNAVNQRISGVERRYVERIVELIETNIQDSNPKGSGLVSAASPLTSDSYEERAAGRSLVIMYLAYAAYISGGLKVINSAYLDLVLEKFPNLFVTKDWENIFKNPQFQQDGFDVVGLSSRSERVVHQLLLGVKDDKEMPRLTSEDRAEEGYGLKVRDMVVVMMSRRNMMYNSCFSGMRTQFRLKECADAIGNALWELLVINNVGLIGDDNLRAHLRDFVIDLSRHDGIRLNEENSRPVIGRNDVREITLGAVVIPVSINELSGEIIGLPDFLLIRQFNITEDLELNLSDQNTNFLDFSSRRSVATRGILNAVSSNVEELAKADGLPLGFKSACRGIISSVEKAVRLTYNDIRERRVTTKTDKEEIITEGDVLTALRAAVSDDKLSEIQKSIRRYFQEEYGNKVFSRSTTFMNPNGTLNSEIIPVLEITALEAVRLALLHGKIRGVNKLISKESERDEETKESEKLESGDEETKGEKEEGYPEEKLTPLQKAKSKKAELKKVFADMKDRNISQGAFPVIIAAGAGFFLQALEETVRKSMILSNVVEGDDGALFPPFEIFDIFLCLKDGAPELERCLKGKTKASEERTVSKRNLREFGSFFRETLKTEHKKGSGSFFSSIRETVLPFINADGTINEEVTLFLLPPNNINFLSLVVKALTSFPAKVDFEQIKLEVQELLPEERQREREKIVSEIEMMESEEFRRVGTSPSPSGGFSALVTSAFNPREW